MNIKLVYNKFHKCLLLYQRKKKKESRKIFFFFKLKNCSNHLPVVIEGKEKAFLKLSLKE